MVWVRHILTPAPGRCKKIGFGAVNYAVYWTVNVPESGVSADDPPTTTR